MDGIRLPWTRRGPPAKPIAVAAPPETAFGLQTVYEPSNPSLNIIFVHGLGGSTKGTWTDSHSGSFWPLWLSELPDFKDARILTFGYNSAWHKIWKPNSVLDISDFAKQLVHDLWLHYANHGNGSTIFIVHSMGGLVVKKALITAHAIQRYNQINYNTIAVAFLGTPHRGATLADLLKNVLRASFSEARFVNDLSPDGQSIKDINDTFAERAVGIELASFWESTNVIVAEYSATLGLADEVRVPLNGDHLSIVRYASKEDNNYRIVSGTLRGLVQAAINKQARSLPHNSPVENSIHDDPTNDTEAESPNEVHILQRAMDDNDDGKTILDKLDQVVKIYTSCGKLNQAAIWQRQVYDYLESRRGDTLVIVHCMHQMGITLCSMQKFEEAATWAQKVFDYFQKMNFRRDRDIAALNLCLYLLGADDEHAWRSYYRIAKTGLPLTFHQHIQLVKALGLRRGFLDEAEEHLKALWEMWDILGQEQLLLVQMTSRMAWMYAAREDLGKSLHYYQLEVHGYEKLGQPDNVPGSTVSQIARLRNLVGSTARKS